VCKSIAEDAVHAAGDRVVIVPLAQYVPGNRLERFLYNDNGRRIRDALRGQANVLIADVPYRRS